MSELTQIDGSFQNIAMGGDKRNWDAGANRWTKGDNDRLYFNDCKYVDYVDLESLFVHTDAPNTTATAEIDGDTLTVEIVFEDDIANKHKEMSATFELPDALAEEVEGDDDEDEGEPEVVCDGGEDDSSHVGDDEILDAIERHDDPDNPDALDVPEVRTHLARIQRDLEACWAEHMDAVEDGHAEVVADDGDVIVLADHTGHGWGEEFDALDIEDVVAQRVIKTIHHAVARRHTDHSWSTVSPIVVQKPDGARTGERYVQAVTNSLLRRGLSPGQAWAFYGVEIRGHSRNKWAGLCGYNDHSAVSEPLRKAKRKLP